ncbi:hypothetical protein EO98_01365 [Methanosarcina sp. 2.H.T.1A.6]|uniref:hypothetical protein n=1 Tax=unclassified Methanosarcina TaxID=2644672 RepID=UPI0006213F88|nr:MULTISPECIES: hypothetical protein [unclassified Methanosarcina]KKG14921.1 hypothetical protein EO94_13430 [Methanosarcina sp. 2.H.T.1A.3]KKG21047.1 hypothetical protein EO98_01365 [Methanosarcina sp. 2.H.T.1A.6]KKG21226.1 hypothetical protein EO97_01820 [Methanosarcina sp. 2.H.T.1A.15]KKG27296.1 hypothetical protein EO96_10200 [Methanosarcina sp. 2.H.T.1A.8]
MIKKLIKIIPWVFINVVRLFNLTELYQPTYNPKKHIILKSDVKKRKSDDRVSAIQNNVDFSSINTYLDIGSQLGYFVFKLSESHELTLAQGFEMNDVSCAYSNALVYLNDLKNISFVNCKVTPNFIKNMPNYDIISFLNVFHHIVYFDGFESADEIMHELYNKTNSYFIFETGQFDEKGYYWSDSLLFMDKNPVTWIQNYLVSIGYKKVTLINEFPTHLSDNTRAFFICSK